MIINGVLFVDFLKYLLIVHTIQAKRATQGRWLMNEIVRERKVIENYEDE